MLREASEEVSYLEWNYVPSQAVTDRERFRRERATARAAAESSSIFQALSPRAKERSRRMSEREDYWYSNDYKFLDMTHNMDDYALILELWEPPRADSIRTYGLIAPAVFCEIATGKPRYELVTELLSSCSRKEFDLRKRATYFQKQFSEPYRVLRSRLEMIHENGGLPGYVPHVDFEELLTKLEKSST